VDIVSYRVDSINPLRLTRIGGIIGSSDLFEASFKPELTSNRR